jgi:segregation and condensation protein B
LNESQDPSLPESEASENPETVGDAPGGDMSAAGGAPAGNAEAAAEAVAGAETAVAVEEAGSEAVETVEVVEAEEAESAWTPEPDKLLCALLFASNEYLTGKALREIMGDDWDLQSLRRLVKETNRKLEEQGQAFELVEVDGTFRVRTRTQYYPWVRKLFKDSNPRRLSQASLETLAIIAYKQPITKAEIESIRGVNVDGCMKSLLEKKLVDVNGRTDAMGGAFTYSTTREFMRYFGVNRVPDDLPRLTEFEAIVNAQALIPQIGPDGSVIESDQQEPDGEQMSLDQLE